MCFERNVFAHFTLFGQSHLSISFACDQTLARGGLKPNLDKHDSYPDFLPSPCGGPAQHGWWKDAVGHDVSKSAAMNLKHSPFFTSAVESISAISDVCSLLKKLKKCQLKTQICSAEAGPVGCIFMHGRWWGLDALVAMRWCCLVNKLNVISQCFWYVQYVFATVEIHSWARTALRRAQTYIKAQQSPLIQSRIYFQLKNRMQGVLLGCANYTLECLRLFLRF